MQIHRDYNTISVGMLNDLLSSIALENRGAILERNHGILHENLSLLDGWIANELRLSYVKPKSATTAWVRAIPARRLAIFALRYSKRRA